MLYNILFCFSVSYMFISEYIKYLYYRNYKEFICNVVTKLAKKSVLYVKIFQAISLNNHFIDDETNNELLKFTDNAPYDKNDIDLEFICNIMEEYNLRQYSFLPINAGMISLVYKFNDKTTGKDLILKVKRHNIREKLDSSIKNLLFFVKILSYFPIEILNTFEIEKTINKNINLIYQQLDFSEEVKNMKQMKEYCKYMPHVVIPYVNSNFTQKYNNAILMDFIPGIPITQIDKSDYDIYAKIIVKFGLACILNFGFAHGDLHGGNILFIKDVDYAGNTIYKLGVIDFGIIISIKNQTKNKLLNIFVDMFNVPAKETTNKLIHVIFDTKNWDLLNKEVISDITNIASEIVDEIIYKSKTANQKYFYLFLIKLNNYLICNNLNKYDLRLNDDVVKLQVALTMCQGLTLYLAKKNYMDIINEATIEMFHSDLDIFQDND